MTLLESAVLVLKIGVGLGTFISVAILTAAFYSYCMDRIDELEDDQSRWPWAAVIVIYSMILLTIVVYIASNLTSSNEGTVQNATNVVTKLEN